jgi:hypothetical protein
MKLTFADKGQIIYFLLSKDLCAIMDVEEELLIKIQTEIEDEPIELVFARIDCEEPYTLQTGNLSSSQMTYLCKSIQD